MRPARAHQSHYKVIVPDYFHGGGENKRFQVSVPEPVYEAIIEMQELKATVPQTMAKYTLGIRNYSGKAVAAGKKHDSIYKAKVEMKGGMERPTHPPHCLCSARGPMLPDTYVTSPTRRGGPLPGAYTVRGFLRLRVMRV